MAMRRLLYRRLDCHVGGRDNNRDGAWAEGAIENGIPNLRGLVFAFDLRRYVASEPFVKREALSLTDLRCAGERQACLHMRRLCGLHRHSLQTFLLYARMLM